MASLGEELLISADSHVIEDLHFWKNRLPAAFKDQAPVFAEREVGGSFQAHPGGWDPNERVKEMAVDGVSGPAGEVREATFRVGVEGVSGPPDVPDVIVPEDPCPLAKPKSISLAPDLVSMILPGFKSR